MKYQVEDETKEVINAHTRINILGLNDEYFIPRSPTKNRLLHKR